MKFFVKSTAVAIALCVSASICTSAARGQTYPSKPVHILQGTGTGAGDFINRLFATELNKRFGQPFVVESRIGGANSIAGWAVHNAPADGYTLYGGAVTPFSPLNLKQNSMDAAKELQPVSTMALGESFLVVRAELGVTTLQELAAKAKTQRLRFASPAPNTQAIMSVIAKQMGFQYDYIPYKESSQVVAGVLSGDCDFLVNALSGAIPYVESGKLRLIMTFGVERSPLQPNIPTARQAGADFASNWNMALWTTLGTPPDVVAKLGAAVADAVKVPDVQQKILTQYMIPRASSPEELRERYVSEIATYKAANDVAGLKPQ